MGSYSLSGLDPACDSSEPYPPNGCGIHVHEGTDCASAGNHFPSKTMNTTDPWKDIRYKTAAGSGDASGSDVKVNTGKTMSDLMGRAFVIHDSTGKRAACTVLKQSKYADLPDTSGGGSSSEIPSWAWVLLALAILVCLAGVA